MPSKSFSLPAPPERPGKSTTGPDPADRFVLLDKLGAGNFGVVWKAIDKVKGKIVAVKMINMEESEDDIEEIQLEIAHLAQCDTPYVTRLYDSFVRGYKLWIVMEYLAGGSGVDLLKLGTLTEPQIAVVCREMLKGLEYLHSMGKMHRDIKAANVLFADDGRVKLADLGVAAQLTNTFSKRHTLVGTPYWMAPEVIRQAGYDSRGDIWSLGITTIELAMGEPPNSDIHPMRVLFNIPQNPPPELKGDKFSVEMKDFVRLCLMKDPNQRPAARDLLRHPFIKSAGRTHTLAPLIERYKLNRDKASSKDKKTEVAQLTMWQKTMQSEAGWDFGTVKVDAGPSQAVGEEYEEDDLDAERKRLDRVQIEQSAYSTIREIPSDLPDLERHQRGDSIDQLPEIMTPPTPSTLASHGHRSEARSSDSTTGTIRPSTDAPRPSADTASAGPLVNDVLMPALSQAIAKASSSVDRAALAKIEQGFGDLVASNPQLAGKLMMDVLAGFRENGTVRAHLTRAAREPRLVPDIRDTFHQRADPEIKVADYALDSPPPAAAAVAKERNALADLLYLRWLDGLRLRWPLT